MWFEIFDAITMVSVFFCAAAIKMADDFLDYEQDKAGEKGNLREVLGNGLPIYAMLLLSLAIYFNPPLCLSLFLASYGIGMFNDFKRRFPSKLTGFQESMVVISLGIGLCGWRYMVFAFMFTLSVQLIDDCIDAKNDILAGYRNLAHRFGVIESYLLAILSLMVSWWVGKSLFFPVLIAVVTLYSSLWWYQRGRKNA